MTVAVIEGTVACGNCGAETRVSNAWNPTWEWLEQFCRGALDGTYEVACPRCMAEEDQEDAARQRQEARLQAMRERVTRSAIPRAWLDCTWEDLETDAERERAIAAARLWAEGRSGKPGLLLYGAVGRGKSRIAGTAAVHRLTVSAVRWRNAARLIADLRMPFSSPEYAAAARALSGKSALVFDDFDKLPPTEQAVQPIYLAVNEWVEAGRWIIVTSNKDPDGIARDFGPRFGDAVASRLVEHCNVYPVGGRDRRLEP